MKTGERVDVVLDCMTEEKDGRYVARVFVRHVDAPTSEGGQPPPPEFPSSRRNVVATWVGVPSNHTGVAAFAVDAGPIAAPGEAARLSRMLFEAREMLAMFQDIVEGASGQTDAWSRRVRAEIDAYRAERGWSPHGFGGEPEVGGQ